MRTGKTFFISSYISTVINKIWSKSRSMFFYIDFKALCRDVAKIHSHFCGSNPVNTKEEEDGCALCITCNNQRQGMLVKVGKFQSLFPKNFDNNNYFMVCILYDSNEITIWVMWTNNLTGKIILVIFLKMGDEIEDTFWDLATFTNVDLMAKGNDSHLVEMTQCECTMG